MNNRILLRVILAMAFLAVPAISHARWLDPQNGRFQTRDTFTGEKQDPQNLHKYLYCNNDPINGVDPGGQEIVSLLLNIDVGIRLYSPRGAETAPRPLPQRDLTEGEKNLVDSIFGDAVTTKDVTIRKWGYFLGFQSSGTLVTPNGHIYAPPNGGGYSDDYSQEPVPIKADFLHEMTHVWQFQFGMDVKLRRAFGEWNYDYDKRNFGDKDFLDYGIEQEAHIVEDYYLLQYNDPIYDFDQGGFDNPFQDFEPPPLQRYIKVLSKYFQPIGNP